MNEARLFVEDYWSSFLRRNVQLPDGKDLPASTAGATAARKPRGLVLPSLLPEKDRSPPRTTERNKWWPWK